MTDWNKINGLNQLSQLGAQYHGGHWNPYSQAYGSAISQSNWNALARAQMAALQNTFPSGVLARQVSAVPSKPIEYAGIRAGEIVGWRCWFLVDGRWLKSMAMDTVWAPGEPMTGELTEEYRCGGVHAWRNVSGALTYGRPGASETNPVVIGRVALWGEVVEHTGGFRAENAKIVSLDHILGFKWPRLKRLAKLREFYGLTKGLDEARGIT